MVKKPTPAPVKEADDQPRVAPAIEVSTAGLVDPVSLRLRERALALRELLVGEEARSLLNRAVALTLGKG